MEYNRRMAEDESRPGRTIGLEHISFTRAIPYKHLFSGGGFLPDGEESCALWQFLLMAHQALDKVPAQTTLIGADDQVVDLLQLAESAMNIYGLDNLEGMFNETRVAMARREVARSGLPWNMALDAFFRTGGKSSRILDRDPDKVGQ
jgi:hypothetical protein